MKQTSQCEKSASDFKNKPKKKQVKKIKNSSASDLLKYAGAWSGNDLEQCLEEVYLVRGEAKFISGVRHR